MESPRHYDHPLIVGTFSKLSYSLIDKGFVDDLFHILISCLISVIIRHIALDNLCITVILAQIISFCVLIFPLFYALLDSVEM